MATRDPFPMRSTAFCRRMAVMPMVVRLAAAVLLLVGSAAIHAQQATRMHRIGFVAATSTGPAFEAFRQGLRELGYVEGKNIVLEARFADGHSERLPALIAEVIGLKVDVLMVASTPGAVAAKKATTTVPIVFAGVMDPVGASIVATLSRPGSNITGVTLGVGGEAFTGKSFELLKEVVPGASHIAVLLNPTYALNMQVRKEVQAVGRALKMEIDVHEASNLKDLESVFTAIGASGARGLFVVPDPFLTNSVPRIAKFAAERRLPAIHFSKRFTDAGGLMSYGASIESSHRRAAVHVDRILKGTKPSDLPVEQPTHFELVINLKTAKAMGLTIPQSILLRADLVIE